MNELVLCLPLLQRVLLSADPSKALLIDIGLQGVDRGNQHVDSHVEFVTLQQQRISQVLLKHYRLTKNYVLNFVNKFDPATPGQSHWLHDPQIPAGLVSALLELADELHVLAGQVVGFGDDVEAGVSLGAQFLDPLDVLLEQVLPGYLLVPEEVVDLLEIKQVPDADLRLRPGPQQVPGSLGLHAMGQFVPVTSAVEGIVDDVIDIFPLPHHSVQQNLALGWLLALVSYPSHHNVALAHELIHPNIEYMCKFAGPLRLSHSIEVQLVLTDAQVLVIETESANALVKVVLELLFDGADVHVEIGAVGEQPGETGHYFGVVECWGFQLAETRGGDRLPLLGWVDCKHFVIFREIILGLVPGFGGLAGFVYCGSHQLLLGTKLLLRVSDCWVITPAAAQIISGL